MISIIVSTYKPEYFIRFKKNIENNIGVEYEIISIENKGKMGLCEAYNLGMEQAKYPYLCFCHEDIEINLEDWGKKIIDTFIENQAFGLIGVAGSTYKSWTPSGWFFPDDVEYEKVDLYQPSNISNDLERHLVKMPNEKELTEVITLDGCWFCIPSSIAKEFKFDELTFKNYHCYDLDYSLQVGTKYKVGVLYNMELAHYSKGSYTKDWVVETFKLHKKWHKKFPLSIETLTSIEVSDNEYKAFQFILDKTSTYDVCLWRIFKLLYSLYFFKLVGAKKWVILHKWVWGALFRKMKNSF